MEGVVSISELGIDLRPISALPFARQKMQWLLHTKDKSACGLHLEVNVGKVLQWFAYLRSSAPPLQLSPMETNSSTLPFTAQAARIENFSYWSCGWRADR